jgi:hypothetical protein
MKKVIFWRRINTRCHQKYTHLGCETCGSDKALSFLPLDPSVFRAIFTGVSKFIAGMGGSAGPPFELGAASHTGAPKHLSQNL